MSSKAVTPETDARQEGDPLGRALIQNEHVQGQVEQAAADLSIVNAALKDDRTGDGHPVENINRVLDQSETIEANVQAAAAELVSVNDALAEEIDQRQELEQKLSKSDADLNESRVQERRSRHTSLHDGLTGLPNLTLFQDRLRIALAQARRHAWQLAVMFVDLDSFKTINDTHGHDVGDKVLHRVAERLQTVVRAGDTLSRRSGDEFLFLMLEAKGKAEIAAFAHRILENIAQPFDIEGVPLALKASLGMAIFPEDGRSGEELLKHADKAMYAAKHRKPSS